MAIRNPGWYNTNETRDYPLDDTASCLSNTGVRLPQDIVVDLRICWPNHLGAYAFLSAVSVTEKAVTITLQAADTLNNSGNAFVPLAAFSILKSELDVRRTYALEAQYPGVYGYVAFGNGAKGIFTGCFSSPAQGLLAPRAARAYESLPVPSMQKLYQETALTGMILLRGEEPIEIVKESREIDNQTLDVIVIRLKDSELFKLEGSVFQAMAGPCSKRPESGTCGDPQPIEFINTVGPDCDGLLEIEFKGCAVVGRNTTDCSVVVDCSFGLIESCTPPHIPDSEGNLPTEFASAPIESTPPPEEPPIPTVSISDHVVVVGELPFIEGFNLTMSSFVVRTGQFIYVSDDSPADPTVSMISQSESLSESSPSLCYATEGPTSVGTRNVAVWEGFDVTTLFRQVTTEVKLVQGPAGSSNNGGIIINYRPHQTNPGQYVYFIAEINYETQEFRLQRFNGTIFRPVVSASVPGLALDTWYRITVQVGVYGGTSVGITARLDSIESGGTHVVLGPALVSSYLPDDGYFGLGSNRAIARFSYFEVQEWTP